MKTATKKKPQKLKTITTDFRPERNYSSAIPCPKCGAYCERNHETFTEEEIAGDMNCGRRWACCVCAFWCPKCKVRILAKQKAPECD